VVSADLEQGRIAVRETKEVKELRSKILGMELEMNLLSKDLERFKNELLYNNKMRNLIEENLHFLKTSDAAVSLSEYKKIKQQQTLVNQRMKYYKAKIQPLEQILGMKEVNRDEEMRRFEEMYRLQFTNNILEFPYERRKEA